MQVDHRIRQHFRVARVVNLDLAHHLTHNNLDMLVVDINALLAVHLLDFLDLVVVYRARVEHPEDIVRVQRAFIEHSALLDHLAILYADSRRGCQLVRAHFTGITVRNIDRFDSRALGLLNADNAGNLRQSCDFLRFAGLKQLFNAGKALRDIRSGNAAGMESTHRQLRARLADRLRCDNADRLANPARGIHREVRAVAARTYALAGTAFEHRTDLQLCKARRDDRVRVSLVHHFIL